MTTKRAKSPISQNFPLFTSGGRADGPPTSVSFTKVDASKESREIFISSEHTYGVLAFKATFTEGGSGGVALTIKIKYKVPYTDTFGDEITIAELTNQSGTIGKHYRLDYVLGINWMPNTPLKYVFSIPSGDNGDAVEIEGVHIV